MTHKTAKDVILEAIEYFNKMYNEEPNVKVEDEDNVHRIFFNDLLFVIENNKLHIRREINSTYIVLSTLFLQNIEEEKMLASVIDTFIDYTYYD